MTGGSPSRGAKGQFPLKNVFPDSWPVTSETGYAHFGRMTGEQVRKG